MVWTNPRTWVAREQPSAATFNTHVRDNLIDLNLRTVPAGVLMPFAGAAAPSGWLLADGSVVSRTTYANLFAVCGTTYNTGGEAGTDFRLPNLKGRTAAGYDAGQAEFNTVGKTGGAKTHTLSAAEMPSHGHSVSLNADGNHNHVLNIGLTGVNQTSSDVAVRNEYTLNGYNTSDSGTHNHGVNQSNAGSGSAHNILAPYIALPHIIKT
jgi:microcystin-dependent protein